jgi:hypothetical protein
MHHGNWLQLQQPPRSPVAVAGAARATGSSGGGGLLGPAEELLSPASQVTSTVLLVTSRGELYAGGKCSSIYGQVGGGGQK